MLKDFTGTQLLALIIAAGALLVMVPLLGAPRGGTDEHRALLIRLLHLPADVNLVAFESGWHRRNEYAEAIAQLTPEQYDAYTATLDDPTVWTFEPFEFDGVKVSGTPEPGAFAWWDGDLATISLERETAMFWVGWGGVDSRGAEGKPDVWHVAHARTMCFAWSGPETDMRIAGCKAFEPHDGPRSYVRAKLDDDGHRVFIYMP